MKRIKSFEIDHTKLTPGIYVSRTDGDIVTYDLRTRRPNCGDYMDCGRIHTVEHLFATFVRNSEFEEKIIYFGPMGCRTGFYFIVRDMEEEDVISLTVKAFDFILNYDGDIPGASEVECGNYLEHDLMGAKEESARYLQIVRNWSPKRMIYPE